MSEIGDIYLDALIFAVWSYILMDQVPSPFLIIVAKFSNLLGNQNTAVWCSVVTSVGYELALGGSQTYNIWLPTSYMQPAGLLFYPRISNMKLISAAFMFLLGSLE